MNSEGLFEKNPFSPCWKASKAGTVHKLRGGEFHKAGATTDDTTGFFIELSIQYEEYKLYALTAKVLIYNWPEISNVKEILQFL